MGNKTRIRSARIPQLTPPDGRASRGGLYAAKLLFEHWLAVNGRAPARRTCEERLILVQAKSARSALREAKAQARASEWKSKNAYGTPWHFRFVGIVDLLHLGKECAPNEVWYDIRERVRPMERRKALVPLERNLNAIRHERTDRRPEK